MYKISFFQINIFKRNVLEKKQHNASHLLWTSILKKLINGRHAILDMCLAMINS